MSLKLNFIKIKRFDYLYSQLQFNPAKSSYCSSLKSSSFIYNHRSFITSSTMANSNKKTESEWRTVLSPEQFRILREKGTEPANSGKYNKFYKDGNFICFVLVHLSALGTYLCAGCKAPLYKSTSKFDSGCGWPAFFEGLPGAIKQTEDNTFGMRRIEITCSNCDGHLGHVFLNEGFKNPTNERHCVNSVSLEFKE